LSKASAQQSGREGALRPFFFASDNKMCHMALQIDFFMKKVAFLYNNNENLCNMTIAKSSEMRYNHSMLPNGTKIFSFKGETTS
jgi:hypothetical protein